MTFHVDPVANKLQQYLDTGAGMSDLVSTIRAASGTLNAGGYSSGFGYDIDAQSLNPIQRQRFDALLLMIGMG
jgi:hypothetical protein